MGRILDERLVAAVAAAGIAPARVLNVPSGEGRLSARLAEIGLDVVSADLFPEGTTLGPQPVLACDMNERLPFDDDALDAVVSQEGVEHLENPARFFRECRRVLKDGGHLWITTPNVLDLSARLAFLLAGQRSVPAGLVNEETTLWGAEDGRVYHGHAFTLPYFQIRYLLRLAHFDAIELLDGGANVSSRVLYPLLWPVVAFFGSAMPRRRRQRDAKKGKPAVSEALLDELVRAGRSRRLLTNKTLFVHARLREGSFTTP